MDRTQNIIYKSKNEQRKCFYIGRATNGLAIRKKGHKHDCFKKQLPYKFYNFIRKYGWDSFTWEVLAVYSTKEELPPEEIRWLAEQKKEFPDWECLNLTNAGDGGLGYIPSKETRDKMSLAHKGENNYWYGKIGYWSGKKNPIHSERMKGKKNPILSERMKGKNNPFYGHHHTEETNEKIRLFRLGTHPTEITKQK
jgi:group I intron endonuclease